MDKNTTIKQFDTGSPGQISTCPPCQYNPQFNGVHMWKNYPKNYPPYVKCSLCGYVIANNTVTYITNDDDEG